MAEDEKKEEAVRGMRFTLADCACAAEFDLQRQVDGLRRFLIVTEGATSKPHLSKLLSPREADCPFYEDY